MPGPDFDVAIVGAGVVGLAVAERLAGRLSVVVLEKGERYGLGTSSRNSEVIHAGLYYAPGSLKATLCVEGREELYRLCEGRSIPYRKLTKLIVASKHAEIPDLERLHANAERNGVRLELLDRSQTLHLEPSLSACAALLSPETGIISAHGLMDYFFHSAVDRGAIVQPRCTVVGIERLTGSYRLLLDEAGAATSISAVRVVNAAGLGSDRIAELAGIDIDKAGYRLQYCKGSYWSVVTQKASLVSRLVYPVPSPYSLGIHALLDLGGRLRFGPDAEYLPDRTESYDVPESGREKFLRGIQNLLPMIRSEDLSPDMSGIRPKLQRQGEPPRDFVIAEESARGLPGFINLIGIESPGLTASPAIARVVAALIQ